ncbi:MAG: cryptochrome/photolyase family protein, partial [Pseudomonadota bacterium]
MSRLVLVLGDQLTPGTGALAAADPETDRVLMVEVDDEATYVRHHQKKIAFIFSAMRHFAEELREAGWQVDYIRLDEKGNAGSFSGEVARAVKRLKPEAVLLTEPGEWRVRQMAEAWEDELGLPVEIYPDERFLCPHHEFGTWAEGRKQLRMEYFYREMRRKTGLLMEGDKPEGGKWNYDADNRKPAKADLFMPEVPRFSPDKITSEVLELVAHRFSNHFGSLEPFWFATTRKDAEKAREGFMAHALPRFGDYQDAMLSDEAFLYHSVLGLYINAGLLDPLETCRLAEAEYAAGRAPLNAVEGFIRQIIGWREYIR